MTFPRIQNSFSSSLGVSAQRMSASELETALEPHLDGLEHQGSSEAEYPVLFASAPGGSMTKSNLLKSFEQVLTDNIFAEEFDVDREDGDIASYEDLTAEIDTARETQMYLDDLSEDGPQFAQVVSMLRQNLTDLKAVTVGPKAADGSLKVDDGTYAHMLIGRTSDGKLAGIYFGTVET